MAKNDQSIDKMLETIIDEAKQKFGGKEVEYKPDLAMPIFTVEQVLDKS